MHGLDYILSTQSIRKWLRTHFLFSRWTNFLIKSRKLRCGLPYTLTFLPPRSLPRCSYIYYYYKAVVKASRCSRNLKVLHLFYYVDTSNCKCLSTISGMLLLLPTYLVAYLPRLYTPPFGVFRMRRRAFVDACVDRV